METPIRKKRIAIVTYNRIGNGQYNNGVIETKDKQIYVAQNAHKAEWAANFVDSEYIKEITRKNEVTSIIGSLNLGDMDQIFLYVGKNGGEEAIRQTANIPAERITYVLCHCNLDEKMSMISGMGNSKADVLYCKCGGSETLEAILNKLLA